ncbi:MAG: phosphopantetheine-binding protein [Boseongicola sp.]|nr:phosphopantetheine-binding protein [Boseongicola sp.]
MADSLEGRIVEIIQFTLRRESGNSELTLGPSDSMETVGEWDSLSFMSVFCAINEAFGIDPEFDDAVHYLSVPSLHRYLGRVIP